MTGLAEAKAAWVIVFYLLTPGPAWQVPSGQYAGATFTPAPKWERFVFPYHSFNDFLGCTRWLNENKVQPPANVASVVVCEERE